MGLYPLLARAAAIAENENSSFAEALSLAAAERGTPLRRVFADEAEALSHDLGHGGAAEQRAVIDLDNGRIRLEYDHRAGSLRESLDALANHFPTAGANRIQNRLIAFLAEHDGSEELYKTLHNELGLTNQEIEAMGFDLAHRYEPDCDDAYQDIVDYIRFEQETSKMWPWIISGDEMLAQETTLREIAGRLTAAGEWDTESIYRKAVTQVGTAWGLPIPDTQRWLDLIRQEEIAVTQAAEPEKVNHVMEEKDLPINASGLQTLDNIWGLFETAVKLNSADGRREMYALARELSECQNLTDWIIKSQTENEGAQVSMACTQN